MIRAAKLDEHGTYLGMDELEDVSTLTALHLPQITECDLPVGTHRWIPEAEGNNPFGGAFWPITFLDFHAKLKREVDEEAARKVFVDEARKQGISRREALMRWRRYRAQQGGNDVAP